MLKIKNRKSNDDNVSLEKIAETTPAAVVKLDKEGKFIYSSSRVEEDLGLEGKEITIEARIVAVADAWGCDANGPAPQRCFTEKRSPQGATRKCRNTV